MEGKLNPATVEGHTITVIRNSDSHFTICCALMYYALVCADGSRSLEVLREMGEEGMADSIASAIALRDSQPTENDAGLEADEKFLRKFGPDTGN